MGTATRDALLSCTGKRYKTAEVAGMVFRFQNLTERAKGNFEKKILNNKGGVNIEARKLLIIATLVDDEGAKLLENNDLNKLDDLDGNITGRLFEIASAHCGFGEDEVDELEKNSEALAAAAADSPTV